MTLLRAMPLLLSALALACLQTPADDTAKSAKSEPAKTEPAKTEPAKTEPAAPVDPANDAGLRPTTEPLTPEEERLISADLNTLSPEERIARGHALRKKVMMNPESDSAKALQEARAAALAGNPNAVPVTATDAPAEPNEGLVIQAPPHLMKPPGEAPAQ
jgi:hypothetical protein